MTDAQIADAMIYLAQGMSLKAVAAELGISEWEIASLFQPAEGRRQ